AWMSYTQDIIRKYIPASDRVTVLEGGTTRNETIMNAIRYIEEQGQLDDDTLIITHDSVRPFVTHRIIDENIRYAREYGACDTVIPATDTIVESKDGSLISDIPNRKHMYQGQTPQSFRLNDLIEVLSSLTEEEKSILTDACKIFTIKNKPVYMVEGEVFNIKITYPYDMKVAATLLKGKDSDD
ncbi:MAG: D-ribitol-5-phosphate cytidylyltransferase, partial [Clostridia bacterium]|nr:D-ribitol-5-phosphate cytidylyltransferase [Clostridia bacterium]